MTASLQDPGMKNNSRFALFRTLQTRRSESLHLKTHKSWIQLYFGACNSTRDVVAAVGVTSPRCSALSARYVICPTELFGDSIRLNSNLYSQKVKFFLAELTNSIRSTAGLAGRAISASVTASFFMPGSAHPRGPLEAA
jgi:hypothetical protein